MVSSQSLMLRLSGIYPSMGVDNYKMPSKVTFLGFGRLTMQEFKPNAE